MGFFKGDPGKQAQVADNRAFTQANQQVADFASAFKDPRLMEAMSKVQSGEISPQDAVQLAYSYNNPGAMAALASDPIFGSQLATNQVMNNPLYAGLFGQQGLQGQAEQNYNLLGQRGTDVYNQSQALNPYLEQDRAALSGRDESYGLQDSDLAAYGQASGNIGRMFANQEQNLAQSLADRGFGAAPSGIAGQQFSGLYGNKMEQLAGLQQQIAQNRINTAQNLAQARTNADLQRQQQLNSLYGTVGGQQQAAGGLAQGLGQLGMNAQGQQYGQQMTGAQNAFNTIQGNATTQNQGLTTQQNINNELFAQQQQTEKPSTLGQIGGAVLGTGLGALTGGVGAAAGGALSSALFPKKS